MLCGNLDKIIVGVIRSLICGIGHSTDYEEGFPVHITDPVSYTHLLVDLEDCVALIGPSTSGGVKSELLCDLGVPVIVPSATSDTLLPEGDLENSMFRICYTDTAQGKAMAEYCLLYTSIPLSGDRCCSKSVAHLL